MMIQHHGIEAKLVGAADLGPIADATIHRHQQIYTFAVQFFDGGQIQAVAFAFTFGNVRAHIDVERRE